MRSGIIQQKSWQESKNTKGEVLSQGNIKIKINDQVLQISQLYQKQRAPSIAETNREKVSIKDGKWQGQKSNRRVQDQIFKVADVIKQRKVMNLDDANYSLASQNQTQQSTKACDNTQVVIQEGIDNSHNFKSFLHSNQIQAIDQSQVGSSQTQQQDKIYQQITRSQLNSNQMNVDQNKQALNQQMINYQLKIKSFNAPFMKSPSPNLKQNQSPQDNFYQQRIKNIRSHSEKQNNAEAQNKEPSIIDIAKQIQLIESGGNDNCISSDRKQKSRNPENKNNLITLTTEGSERAINIVQESIEIRKRFLKNAASKSEIDLKTNSKTSRSFLNQNQFHLSPHQQNFISNPEEITQQLVKQNLMIFNKKKSFNGSMRNLSQTYMAQQLKTQAAAAAVLKNNNNFQKQSFNQATSNQNQTPLSTPGITSTPFSFSMACSAINSNPQSALNLQVNESTNTNANTNINNNNTNQIFFNHNSQSNYQSYRQQTTNANLFSSPLSNHPSVVLSTTNNFYNKASNHFYGSKVFPNKSNHQSPNTRQVISVSQQGKRTINNSIQVSSPTYKSPHIYKSPNSTILNEEKILQTSNQSQIKGDSAFVLSQVVGKRKTSKRYADEEVEQEKQKNESIAIQTMFEDIDICSISEEEKKNQSLPLQKISQQQCEKVIEKKNELEKRSIQFIGNELISSKGRWKNLQQTPKSAVNKRVPLLKLMSSHIKPQILTDRRPCTATEERKQIIQEKNNDKYTLDTSNIHQQFLAKVISTERSAIFHRIKSAARSTSFQKHLELNINQDNLIQKINQHQNKTQEINPSQCNNNLNNTIQQYLSKLSSKDSVVSNFQNKYLASHMPRKNKGLNQFKYQTEPTQQEEENDDEIELDSKFPNNNKLSVGQLISPWNNEKQADLLTADDSLDFVRYTTTS